ncbi:unnamed protein product [[Candida] boidinii]|nr:unnamed protein product [[Candida] boidinii]
MQSVQALRQQQMLHPQQPHQGQFVPLQMQQDTQKMQAPAALPQQHMQQRQNSGIPTQFQQFPQQIALPSPQQQQLHHQQLHHQQLQQQNRMGMGTDKNVMKPPQSTHTNFQPMKQDPIMDPQLFPKDENDTTNSNQLAIQAGQQLQPNLQLGSQTPDPLSYQGFASPFEWSTNEQDLDRFFDELQRVGSPMSTKSNQSPVDTT